MKTIIKVFIAAFIVITLAAVIAVAFDIDIPRIDLGGIFNKTDVTDTDVSDTDITDDSGPSSEICAHDMDMVKVEATCTEDGSATFTCKLCGLVNVQKLGDALGHHYNRTTQSSNCSRCGEAESLYLEDVYCINTGNFDYEGTQTISGMALTTYTGYESFSFDDVIFDSETIAFYYEAYCVISFTKNFHEDIHLLLYGEGEITPEFNYYLKTQGEVSDISSVFFDGQRYLFGEYIIDGSLGVGCMSFGLDCNGTYVDPDGNEYNFYYIQCPTDYADFIVLYYGDGDMILLNINDPLLNGAKLIFEKPLACSEFVYDFVVYSSNRTKPF